MGLQIAHPGILFLGAILTLPAVPDCAGQDPTGVQHIARGSTLTHWIDTSGYAGAAFHWFINGEPVKSGLSGSFLFQWNQPGEFSLQVWVVVPDGCSGIAGQTAIIVTDVTVPEEPDICPNPMGGPELVFRIRNHSADEIRLELFSTDGRLVARVMGPAPGHGDPCEIRLGHELPQGAYLYRITAGKITRTGKIAVIRTY